MVCSFETQGIGLPGPDAAMPWGRIGGSAAIYSIELYGLNDVINDGLPPYGNPQPYGLIDLVRGDSLPIRGVFGAAMHISGPSADLLDISKAPSAVGSGGYSSSPLPTTTAGTRLANPSATSLAPAPMSLSSPAPSGIRQVAGMQSGAEGESGPSDNTAPERPAVAAAAEEPAAHQEGNATDNSGDSTVVIWMLEESPDPAREPRDGENRATGEPAKSTGQTQQQLAAPDKDAETVAGKMQAKDDTAPVADGTARPAQAKAKNTAVNGMPIATGEGKVFVIAFTGNKLEKDSDIPAEARQRLSAFELAMLKNNAGENEYKYLFDELNISENNPVGKALVAQERQRRKTMEARPMSAREQNTLKLKGPDLVDERIMGWDAADDEAVKMVLAALAGKDEGFTARIILIGFSYGASRAVDEADKLSAAVYKLKMLPEVHLFIIDGVEALGHPDMPPHGMPLIRFPETGALARIVTFYSTVARNEVAPPLGGMGSQMFFGEDIPVNAPHFRMARNRAVLARLLKELIKLETEPFTRE